MANPYSVKVMTPSRTGGREHACYTTCAFFDPREARVWGIREAITKGAITKPGRYLAIIPSYDALLVEEFELEEVPTPRLRIKA